MLLVVTSTGISTSTAPVSSCKCSKQILLGALKRIRIGFMLCPMIR